MLCEKMKNLVNYLKTKFNNDLRKYGLTASQYVVLKYLVKNDDKDIIQKDICDYLVLKHSTVVGIIKRLYDKKLIKRSDNFIKITDNGKDLFFKIGDYEEDVEKLLLSSFSKEDIVKFSEMLDIMLNNVNKKGW